jgi:hypothetical protein
MSIISLHHISEAKSEAYRDVVVKSLVAYLLKIAVKGSEQRLRSLAWMCRRRPDLRSARVSSSRASSSCYRHNNLTGMQYTSDTEAITVSHNTNQRKKSEKSAQPRAIKGSSSLSIVLLSLQQPNGYVIRIRYREPCRDCR